MLPLGLPLGVHLLLHHRESMSTTHDTESANDSEVMESFDMFLNGNFVALGAFQVKYGVPSALSASGYAIPTAWQSALFQSGQCGAFIGVFLAGPVTNRLGYRWTAIAALIMMNATIFISFFVSSLLLLLVLRLTTDRPTRSLSS